MTEKTKKFLKDYGASLGLFALTLLIVAVFRYFSPATVNLSLLVVGAIVVCAWYVGRGPSLLLAALFQLISVAMSTQRSFSLRYILVQLNTAVLLGAIAYLVSGRRRNESEIRRLNEELELRVAERTAQLEAANKELEAFSYSVSHDLRAPLRSINGFARILSEDYADQLPAEAQNYLRSVHRNAQRMGELVDDLLAFSRLGRQTLSKRRVDLNELVEDVAAELRSHEPGREVTIHCGELPACNGDPSLIRQIFVNLLGNALKYTRDRDVAGIEIGFIPSDGEPSAGAYFVKDNGVGFDMKYSDKLFGVFQRLHRMEDYEGTGLGLAIVQRIVHRHDGRIWAEAEVDKGAAFYFTLPAAH
ncbi:MAG: hybrid sensor histidine kinase/response regulator [Acidobacteria bacterium]|nr:hybrid sensor histidine kinase/response regulator [Acidobacteriota bacterium]MCW5968002.1 hypothetical protein [Blastocatellales bacterium]